MQNTIRLRFRLYLMVLPLMIVVVILSGFLSSMESMSALTRIANRHMAFKAEQLRDFFHSEWDVISSLDLDKQAEYRAAFEESFRTYAQSILRGKTELIFVFDADGNIVMQIGLSGTSRSNVAPSGNKPVVLDAGWFSDTLFGEERIGVVFALEPFGWTVAITDLQATFFQDIRNIQVTHAWILVAAAVLGAIFLSIFIGHIMQPVERLAGTIGHIAETKDLSKRARIEFDDEIGELAERFNSMIGSLQENNTRIEEAGRAEKQARLTAVEREEMTLYILARVSEFRDEETGKHLKRIGALSALFAELAGESKERQDLLRHAAPLHDIGKIGIPDSILHKPGSLNKKEKEKIKQHTVLGSELLKNAKSAYLVEGAEIAMTHHERWDGTGYPHGLSGEAIPLAGRIVSIVDVFDALTSNRPYKEQWTVEQALEYIVQERGKRFDPRLVDLFVENFEAFKERLANVDEEVGKSVSA